MAEGHAQGSEFEALDPEFLVKTRKELDQAQIAFERAKAAHDEFTPTYEEVVGEWMDLEDKVRELEAARDEVAPRFEEAVSELSELEGKVHNLDVHIRALKVLLGEQPFIDPQLPMPQSPARSAQEFRIEDIGRLGLLPDLVLLPGHQNANLVRQVSADKVVALLEEADEPLHYRDIHKRLEERGHRVEGADPASTLLSRFFKDPRLYRPRRGTYGLVEWQERNRDAAQSAPSNVDGPPHRSKGGLTARRREQLMQKVLRYAPLDGPLEVAREVLSAEGRPLHYAELADQMLATGKWMTEAQSPPSTLNSYISTHMRQHGDKSCFFRAARGVYGLSEWRDNRKS